MPDDHNSPNGPGWGWAAYILEDLEQANLRRQIDLDRSIMDPMHASVRTQILPVFLCPSDPAGAKIIPVYPVLSLTREDGKVSLSATDIVSEILNSIPDTALTKSEFIVAPGKATSNGSESVEARAERIISFVKGE